MSTLTLDQALQQAITHHRAGDLSKAERFYRAILRTQPNHPEANHNLGLLAMSMDKAEVALSFFKLALESHPNQARFCLSYVEALIHTNQLDTAKSLLLQGRELRLIDEVAKVEALVEHLAEPTSLEIEKLLTLFYQGDDTQAEQLAQDLTQRFPNHGFVWKALGAILARQGRLEESLTVLQKTAEFLPNDAENYKNLGITLKELGRLEEAETYHRLAIAHKPNYAEAYYNLGITLKELARLDEAENYYRLAIAAKPDYAEAYNNLGNTLKDLGRLTDAENCYRSAVDINPNYAEAQSNLLFVYNYTANHSVEFQLAEAKRYAEMVVNKVEQRYQHWQCDPQPQRLRIGFVSGDFHHHVVSYFLVNVLRHLQALSCELIAYPTHRKTDAVTEQLKSYFTDWKPIFALTDPVAAQLIHDDAVHILVDLSGHTAHNRLSLFAWKPAPIQVTWLGYWATTGIAEIDYIFVDSVGVPDTNHAHFIEKVRYLPDTRLCFSTPTADLAVNPLPALTNGYLTFGCFQNLSKVTDAVLALWSRILAQLPNARLRFQNVQFGDAKFTELFYLRLARHQIDTDRISTHGSSNRKNYLAAHNEVDFILDTFPYTGGTTTCEALWMGVPTLTIAGETLLARQGTSLLSAVGLQDWIVIDQNNYVEKALAFAANLDELVRLRSVLREQVVASPLFDAQRFAKNLEATLWELWRDYQSESD